MKLMNELNEDMETMIYTVRKTGVVRTKSFQKAKEIKNEAAKQGYSFGVQKFGWNYNIVDLDD